ncbi:hypothetical protein JCM1393_27090 [Clostridium carnis]
MKFLLSKNNNLNSSLELGNYYFNETIDKKNYMSIILISKIILACFYAFGLGYSLFYCADNMVTTGFIFLGLLILCCFALEIPHEFIHLLFFPQALKNKETYLEYNYKKLQATTYSENKLTKFRFLCMLITPFILLTIIPTIISYYLEFNIYLYAIASANAIISGSDLIFFIIMLYKASFKTDILVNNSKFMLVNENLTNKELSVDNTKNNIEKNNIFNSINKSPNLDESCYQLLENISENQDELEIKNKLEKEDSIKESIFNID